METLREFPVSNLQGLVVLPGGDRVVSFWGPSPVLRFAPEGHDLVPLIEGAHAVGDIGYDAKRHRLLVPEFREDSVLFIDLAE